MKYLEYILSGFALLISVRSLAIAKKAWHKSRAIYGIERNTLKYVRGRRDDLAAKKRMKEINKKLTSGKYTIISINSRGDEDFEIILGRIKK